MFAPVAGVFSFLFVCDESKVEQVTGGCKPIMFNGKQDLSVAAVVNGC